MCHVVGGNTCGVNTLMTVTVTRWLRELCSTQAKVEVILLKAAWLSDSDSSVTCDTLGNQAAPHCIHSFLQRGAPWNFDRVFSPIL